MLCHIAFQDSSRSAKYRSSLRQLAPYLLPCPNTSMRISEVVLGCAEKKVHRGKPAFLLRLPRKPTSLLYLLLGPLAATIFPVLTFRKRFDQLGLCKWLQFPSTFVEVKPHAVMQPCPMVSVWEGLAIPPVGSDRNANKFSEDSFCMLLVSHEGYVLHVDSPLS